MTPYETAIELCITGVTDRMGDFHPGMIHITTREQVKVVTWLPFQLLYVEMVKAKEIPGLIELDEKTKRNYWQEAKAAQPDRPKWKQIWIAQSLYVYDLITSNDKA